MGVFVFETGSHSVTQADLSSPQPSPVGFKPPSHLGFMSSGIIGMCHHIWLIFNIFVETRSHYILPIAHASLVLLGSTDPLASASQSAVSFFVFFFL